MEVLVRYGLERLKANARRSLKGLRFVPYYGCTLARQPRLAKEKYFQAEMETILTALGAEAMPGAHYAKSREMKKALFRAFVVLSPEDIWGHVLRGL